MHKEHGVIILGFFCSFASLISILTTYFLMDFFSSQNVIIGLSKNNNFEVRCRF